MNISQFISRLNWRQMLLQFVGMWLLMYGFTILAILHDVEMHDVLQSGGWHAGEKLAIKRNVFIGEVVMQRFYWVVLPGQVGLIVAFIIAIFISRKQHWLWVNSLVAFFLLCVLCWFDITGWYRLRHMLLYVGDLFRNTAIRSSVNGGILLGLGIFILFWKRGWRWIEQGNMRQQSH